MNGYVLQVKGLTTCFHQQNGDVFRAVDDIDFEICRGQTYALLGESGCGKSISALSVMRLHPQPASKIEAGEVMFNGHNLLSLSEQEMESIRGKNIAMIFQDPQSSLNPVMTIGDQIGEVLEIHTDLVDENIYHRAIYLLNEVGIAEPEQQMNAYPHQLSGGMKQRVMIAMALATEPDLLIADEPTTALDVTIQAQILALLKRLQQKTGMAMLFITHDLAVASQISNHVGVMRSGKIVETAPSEDFFAEPQHPYSQQLFDALPSEAKRQLKLASYKANNHTEISQVEQNSLLEVHDLNVHFPIKKGLIQRTVGYVKAVNGVSFSLKAGETLAVVGESGSGKTTIGKAVLQLIDTTSGSVSYKGQLLQSLSNKEMNKVRASLQVVFQDPYSSMNPRMTVAQIIGEAYELTSLKTQQQKLARTDELLTKVGLSPEHKTRYPHEFSGGQRQRIAIARALAAEPELIICDEPTSALDVSVQAQILDLLLDLQKELGLAYLFITHNIAVVDYLAHNVAVMHKGEIVELGSREQVLKEPQHPYTEQLLTAVPQLPTAV